MTPRREPVPRAREAASWLGGFLLVGILAAGVIGAAVLLWENIDVRELVPSLVADPQPTPLPRMPSAALAAGGGFTAVLFNSPRSAAFFPDSAFHARALAGWTGVLRSAGARIREVDDASGLMATSPDEVLVLAETPCLARAERDAIVSHIARGGSVVSNWAIGARDASCEWLGWGVVTRLTNAEDVREIPPREALFLTVPQGLPLSPGLDPGTRIELLPDPSMALRMSGPKVYWSDWALNPAPDESGGGADVAAAAGWTAAGGRSAWFGLRLGQGVTPRDSLLIDRVVRNGILWAAGRPVVEPGIWPGGRRAAAMVTLDVESQFENAADVAQLMRDEGLPGTFFAVSRLVRDATGLGEALSAAGEVATQTPDHAPIDGLAPPEQLVRLRDASEEIERWAGVSPVGLRPPEEAFDVATLSAWSQVGGTYLLGLNESRSGSPEIHSVDSAPDSVMILVPRVIKDDYNVFVQEGALRVGRLSDAWLAGLRKLRALGGVAVVSGHTQILNSPARLEALRTISDTLRAQNDWWVVTGRDVARWWRGRAGLTLTAGEPDSTAVLTARIETTGPGVDDLWLNVVMPIRGDEWIPLVDGEPVEYATTSWGLRIPVGSVEPGRSRLVSIRLPGPPAADSVGPPPAVPGSEGGIR